ncbi:hypothetical protein [Streptomyces sp. NPDC008121]|uniref:hypothetical protein n=1 Tax=Streptomyces sp. NPDC008121 TaxID=3364809 RepID=UPI0036F03687
MRRRIAATAAVVSSLGIALGLSSAAQGNGAPSPNAGTGGASSITGYWMGTDPLDGGDSRRGFTRNADGTIAMAGRDSYLTLCDRTDRGLAAFSDGAVKGRTVTTDRFEITCFNNGNSVTLRAEYELISPVLLRENLTTLEGEPVTEILFHKVSATRGH